MSAQPVGVLAAIAAALDETEGTAAHAPLIQARAAVAELTAENVALRQRSMQASGYGALLSAIVGAGVLRDYPDLRERAKRAVADHEAHMVKVLSGGGE